MKTKRRRSEPKKKKKRPGKKLSSLFRFCHFPSLSLSFLHRGRPADSFARQGYNFSGRVCALSSEPARRKLPAQNSFPLQVVCSFEGRSVGEKRIASSERESRLEFLPFLGLLPLPLQPFFPKEFLIGRKRPGERKRRTFGLFRPRSDLPIIPQLARVFPIGDLQFEAATA